jgi:hypothetical protein
VERFDPVMLGGVPFDWGYQRRKRPRLLGHWHTLREQHGISV